MSEDQTTAFGEVTTVDPELIAVAAAIRQDLGVDHSTLGHLTPVMDWLAACQGRPLVQQPQRPRLVIFAGDHCALPEPVRLLKQAESEEPEPSVPEPEPSVPEPEPSARETDTSLTDPLAGALITTLAAASGSGINVVDVAAARDSAHTVADYKIRRSHPPIWITDALTDAECTAALALGRRIADLEVDGGADLLIPALVGTGHAVALSTLVCVLSGMEPVEAVGFADEDDPADWGPLVAAVRDAAFRCRQQGTDVSTLLRAVAGADLAAMAGFLAQAAVRRTPVLLDGQACLVAAVLAHRLASGAQSWFITAGPAPRRSGRRLGEMLGLKSVVDIGVDSNTAAGALFVLPLISTAAAVLAQIGNHSSAAAALA